MPLSSFGVGAVRSLLLKSRKRRSANANDNNCACTIAATDITTTVGVSAREADDHSSKRARQLQHHPPSLEISATFESASLSPTSSSSSPSSSPYQALAKLTNENDGTVNPKRRRRTYSSNEYYTAAISCAKSRLHAAQRISLHSEQNLSRANEEVQHAKALLDAVEMKWGVINIESDDENDDNDANRHSLKTLNRACAGTTAATATSSLNEQTTDFNYDDEDENDDTVQLIQVRIAGESIVHGRYQLHHPTTSHGTVARNATSIQPVLEDVTVWRDTRRWWQVWK